MTVTDAGHAYVEACRRILEDVDEAERAVTGEYREARGGLTVTAPVSFGRLHLLPVVLDFLEAYPDVDIRLVLSDRQLNLLDDNVALAIRIGKLGDSSLIASRIGSTRIVVCASPTYLDRRGRPKKPLDLQTHDCITFDNMAAPDAWRFADPKGDILIPVRSRLTVNTAETAIDAAIAGRGLLRMMHYKIEEGQRAGALELVLESFEPAPLPINFLYPGQGPLPLKLSAFMSFATPRLKARLS